MSFPPYKKVYIIFLFFYKTILAQNFDTCDCSNPVPVGFLNMDEPEDCNIKSSNVAKTNVKYFLFQNVVPDFSSIGFVCMRWKIEKKIVGYFFRSYDTTFTKTEVPVTRSECWDLSQTHLCPNPITGTSPMMTQSGNVWSYNKQPEGDSAYLQEVIYTEFNCVVQQIEVKQN